MIRHALTTMLCLAAFAAMAEVPVERVRLDTQVVERIVDVSRDANKRSLPLDLLRQIAEENIENLRGRKPDGTYEFAYYDRFEAGRKSESCSVQVQREGEFDSCQMKGSDIYRVVVEVPSRRLLVARNRKLWIERVDFEYIPQGSSVAKQSSVDVKGWLEPGSTRGFDLPDIARQVTATVVSRADSDAGSGNILVTVIEARVIDDARSPFANAVASAKAFVRTVERGDPDDVRNGAAAIRAALPPTPASAIAPDPSAPDIYMELQSIEDLLMGDESEKRDGMERLRQLRRRVKPR